MLDVYTCETGHNLAGNVNYTIFIFHVILSNIYMNFRAPGLYR